MAGGAGDYMRIDGKLIKMGLGAGRKTWLQLSRGGKVFQENRLNKGLWRTRDSATFMTMSFGVKS